MTISHCAKHDTYPDVGDPCWQCVNAAYAEGYKAAEKKHKRYLAVILVCLELLLDGKCEEAADLAQKELGHA